MASRAAVFALAFALAAAVVSVFATAGCRGKPTPSGDVAATTAAPPAPAPADAAAPPPLPADAAVPANHYIGSHACADCHDGEHKAWATSWHARALAPAKGRAVIGTFDGAHFAGTSSDATMLRKAGAPLMRTRGPDGQVADFPVDWVVGGKHMQDTITVFPDGRWQVLPVYFHVTGHAWVDYTETKQGAITPAHPFWWTNGRRMANHECLDCHTTDLHVTHDAATGAWTTTFADAGVACESCHGPGGRHAETSARADIVQPEKASKVGEAACARCHGPREPLWPLLDADHAFRVGDDYDEAYDPIVVTLPGGGTSSDFFADGRPSTSSFEYQAMIQSACYRRGRATCLTCHTAPHEARRANDLRDDADKLCRSCHADIAPDHAHHRAAAAKRCVACHMPPTVSGVLDHFADHAIDVPDPRTTATHGVPNACGVCHADKTADQLATSLAAWWPNAAARQARRERLADAFDENPAPSPGGPSSPSSGRADRTGAPASGSAAGRGAASGSAAARGSVAEAAAEAHGSNAGPSGGAPGPVPAAPPTASRIDRAAALRAVLADATEAPTLRGVAAILLGRHVRAAAVADILPLLASDSTVLRAKGCEALGETHLRGAAPGAPPAVAAAARVAGDAAAAHLGDRSLRVRLACALALLDLHDARAEDALHALADAPATAHLMVPHLELGRMLAARRDWPRARHELEQVAQLAPYFADALVKLAGVEAESGDLAAARHQVDAVLAMEPHHAAALALQAKLPPPTSR